MAVQKWRHYLGTRKFVIKTDHESLKYLLEQKVTTPMQQKGMLKLMGLDYSILYRKGKENIAADALSRRSAENGELAAISVVIPSWISEVVESYKGDEQYERIITDLTLNPSSHAHYTLSQGIVRYKRRMCIGKFGPLRRQILIQFHDSALGGHSGIASTYQRIKQYFYWPGLKGCVELFVKECAICARNKSDTQPYAGSLQPLPIPAHIWEDISMDFIESLPKSEGKDTILVIVDRLTKYAHFIPLRHPYAAKDVAKAFMETVYRLHGCPRRIISDRDRVFTSQFWAEFFKLLGVKLHLSTAYHPQTDGQTERLNQCLENYLRCMCSQCPRRWNQWLAHAEWWYNTAYHSSIRMSPYEALYGHKPPILMVTPEDSVTVPEVREWNQERMRLTTILRDTLSIAQNRMKQMADKHRKERSYNIGDWVYLKLQPHRQVTVAGRRGSKLTAKYYGPYEVSARIGAVAYRLRLPEGARVHPVFHVSVLKPSIAPSVPVVQELPFVNEEGSIIVEPEVILNERQVRRNRRLTTEVLVKWKGLPVEQATWEDQHVLKEQFPHIKP